ncbi:MAG: M20 family peptidase [Rhizobacter sp.]|nr:M20 family peptidase [Rhizobacter sp.]
MRKWLAALGLVVLALTVVVSVKTVATPSRQLVVASAAPVAVDARAASERLAAAVRLKTIASTTDADANAAEFLALHAHLQASFPKLHAALRRDVIGKYGLLYTWLGSDSQAAPIALLAHEDVVPIAPGTDGDWQALPFSGSQRDGFVWGRGAWDDKSNLMGILEAVELRVGAGFQPRQTIYLAFGHDEELGGARGAMKIAQLLKERGVHLRWVIDEGLLITEGAVAGLAHPAALVGVAEKGFLTVRLTASAAPGHSSMPPVEAGSSAIGMLVRALTRIEAEQMPFSLGGVGRESLDALAPEMDVVHRVLLSNLWLFGPLVEAELKQSPGGNASFRTTTALTVVNAGQAENVLPGRASALVNFRLLPGDRSEDVVAHVVRAIAEPRIKVEREPDFVEASRVASTDAVGYRTIARTLAELHPDVVVAPGLMIGATDSRHYANVADNIYRFSPMRARPEDLKRFHGTNERISTANYVELIQFYHQLIGNAQPDA